SQKCDSARPICDQCRLRPPKSQEPCQYSRSHSPDSETIQHMFSTIEALHSRIEELELRNPPLVFLDQPYNCPRMIHMPNNSGAVTPELLDLEEPPRDLITGFVDMFLARFAQTTYFFLDPVRFRDAVLPPELQFCNHQRPSSALLSVVYLWGCVLSPILPNPPYTEEGFLSCVLRHLPRDLSEIELRPRITLETIQCQILLSCYYLHVALPVQGRHHSAAAVSLAFTAGLHLRPPHLYHVPGFYVFSHPVLPPAVDEVEEVERTDAFWAAVILNNYWVAAQGAASAIPYGINIDTPWPSGTQGGATIAKFLTGHELDGYSPTALLAKASILFERMVAFSQRAAAQDDSIGFSNLDHRLHEFYSFLPPLPGNQTLLITHVLVNLAIVHLHAVYFTTSDISRAKAWSAAARIADGVANFDFITDAYKVDPILGPLFSSLCSIWISASGCHHVDMRAQNDVIEVYLGTLTAPLSVSVTFSMEDIPTHSILFFEAEKSFTITRDARAAISRPV
ncbi:hypothetical protein C8J57DRAFT_1635603, partial [Mycena rebaudengoi]